MRARKFLLALLVIFFTMASLVLIESVRLFHLFRAQSASDRPGPSWNAWKHTCKSTTG